VFNTVQRRLKVPIFLLFSSALPRLPPESVVGDFLERAKNRHFHSAFQILNTGSNNFLKKTQENKKISLTGNF
jgi:hypothetical protein